MDAALLGLNIGLVFRIEWEMLETASDLSGRLLWGWRIVLTYKRSSANALSQQYMSKSEMISRISRSCVVYSHLHKLAKGWNYRKMCRKWNSEVWFGQMCGLIFKSVLSQTRFRRHCLAMVPFFSQRHRVSGKGGQTNICHSAVLLLRPHGARHANTSVQIYRATFGCVRAVCVDKAGHNVCHPITAEIYLPDRHIRLQGPVCRLAESRRQQRRGQTVTGQRFKLLIITNLTQWTVKAWHECPHEPLCFSIHCCPVRQCKPITPEV